MDKIQVRRKAEVAAYNHGFCYCVTYSSRKSIRWDDLDKQASEFYPSQNLSSWFRAGYDYALTQLNTGKITACQLGENINAS